MNEKKKAEWKGMFKGVVVTLLLLGVFSAGVVYAAVTLMTDEGFFVGDTSMTDGKVTINSTEITDDSFGNVTFFNYAFTAEKTYAVPELANDQYYILDILKETTVTPTGVRFIATQPFIMASGKSNEDSNNIWACHVIGMYDTQKSVGDSSYVDFLGGSNLDNGVKSNTTYSTAYTTSGEWGDTTTEGQTYYAYILLYGYCDEVGGCEACTAYFKNFSAGVILYQ